MHFFAARIPRFLEVTWTKFESLFGGLIRILHSIGVPGLRGEVHRPLQLQRKDIVGVQLEFLEEGQMATLSFFKKGVLICACLLPYVDLSTGFRPAVLGFGGRDISVRAK